MIFSGNIFPGELIYFLEALFAEKPLKCWLYSVTIQKKWKYFNQPVKKQMKQNSKFSDKLIYLNWFK